MSWQHGQRDLTSLKVGSAVILGLAILVFGLVWGQDLLQAGRTNRITVFFEDGFGLNTGDPVLVAGVKKGQVAEITLTADNLVAVEMMIDEDVMVYTSSLFTIESEGIIGSRYINITANPGGTVLAEGDTLVGLNAASLNDVFRNVQRLVIKIEDLTGSIQDIVTDEEVRRQVRETFDNFGRTISLLNQVMIDNQDQVSASIENLSSVVDNVNRALVQNMDDLERALQSFTLAGNEFARVAVSIDTLSHSVNGVVDRFQSGEGTFWRLAESDTLYRNLFATVARLDSLITDIKNNPKKYFTIRIF